MRSLSRLTPIAAAAVAVALVAITTAVANQPAPPDEAAPETTVVESTTVTTPTPTTEPTSDTYPDGSPVDPVPFVESVDQVLEAAIQTIPELAELPRESALTRDAPEGHWATIALVGAADRPIVVWYQENVGDVADKIVRDGSVVTTMDDITFTTQRDESHVTVYAQVGGTILQLGVPLIGETWQDGNDFTDLPTETFEAWAAQLLMEVIGR